MRRTTIVLFVLALTAGTTGNAAAKPRPKFTVFLASDDSSYLTGQVLHPNGGTVVNG